MRDKMKKKTVVIGMSGGVDSSVSALLLKQQGYDVIGLFMKNWEEKNKRGVCSSSLEYEDVIKVCDTIDIPCYSVEFTKEYQDLVFQQFLEGLKKGFTPNPDILCNREIKFHHFLHKALTYGADYIATGHYCQNLSITGKNYLAKALDPEKDQSYFLYTLQESILQKVLFPIGHLCKKQVRKIAKEHHLVTHDKKDSVGICFIGKRNFTPFLAQYLSTNPGPIKRLNGELIGKHKGICFYTIGQRKGLDIGGKGEAWYVVDKDPIQNIVYVEQGKEHPALFAKKLNIEKIHWITESKKFPLHCNAKIRYRQEDTPCIVYKNGEIIFTKPQRAITPGQSVVLYQNHLCLGGGVITQVGPSCYQEPKRL
jgi:tRNA-uridine 2-sulfurtransferase